MRRRCSPISRQRLGLQQLLASVNQEISKALVSHLTESFLGTSTPSSTAESGQGLDVIISIGALRGNGASSGRAGHICVPLTVGELFS